MSYIITNNKHYKNIASAIRSKLRVETKYTPEEMASAIGNIPSSADGTNDPVAGIYYTDPDENGKPTKVKIVGMKTSSSPFAIANDTMHEHIQEIDMTNNDFTTVYPGTGSYLRSLQKVFLPPSITDIPANCFVGVNNLFYMANLDKVKVVGQGSISNARFPELVLKNIEVIEGFAFRNLDTPTLFLGNSLRKVSVQSFYDGYNFVNVTLENGFNATNLNLSNSKKYSHDTILSWFNALKDRTNEDTQYTLIIGNYNLKKMTEEEISIATNKNWKIT